MAGKGSINLGTSPRSALSASLEEQRLQRTAAASSAPLPHTALDLPQCLPDERRPPRPPSSARRANSAGIENAAVGSFDQQMDTRDMPFGTSPMIGSPWPYLVRQQQKMSPQQAEDSPRAAARPSRISWDHRPNTEFTSLSYRRPTPCVEEDGCLDTASAVEPLLGGGDGDGPVVGDEDLEKDTRSRRRGSVLSDMLYGLINAIVGAPTMISFAAIIFSDSFFSPYLGQLARLAFLSSAIHQSVFTIFSNLPFAVGQVQDVGLIFLSAMATAIAHDGLSKGVPKAEILGTTLATITVSTFIVGLLIILVGHFRLASLVQYVPLPVVGGYLGYVGYFCLAAGVGLACSTTVNTFVSWANLFHVEQLIKLGPAAGSTLALWLTMHYLRSPLALPAVLLCIPLLFHAVLLGAGWSLQDAADAGWVMQGEKGVNFWDLYALFNIHDWRLSTIDKLSLLRQTPKLLALFFVVAFGSSLDVAAIQAGLSDPLDFNHELKTVGLSNMVSGLLGAGFTGSYIFSQTIFSMRAHVQSKLHGLIIAGAEFALFAIPYNLIQYVPNFFFGSLLMLFGVEIISDWLVFSFRKVTRAEFVLLWATYLAIMFTSLEAGIGIGIILATFYFAFSYARVHIQTFTVVPSRSGVVRTLSEREVLEIFMSRMAALSLSGYIFFGSSVSIAEQVTTVARALLDHDEAVQDRAGASDGKADMQSSNPLWTGDLRERTRQAFAASPRFILLDFRLVHGLDATAAQSLGTLWGQLQKQGVELVLTHLKSASMRALLEAHGVAVDDLASKGAAPTAAARVFDSMELGVEHCEDRFLEVALQYALFRPRQQVMSLEDMLRTHDSVPNMLLGKNIDHKQVADSLEPFMKEISFAEGEDVFAQGDSADNLYIIEEGSVCMHASFLRLSQEESMVPIPANLMAIQPDRRFDFGPSAIIGTTDFFLQRPRSFRAFAMTDCRMQSISHAAFDQLAQQAPEALIVLLTIIVRTSILDGLHVWEYLERINSGK